MKNKFIGTLIFIFSLYLCSSVLAIAYFNFKHDYAEDANKDSWLDWFPLRGGWLAPTLKGIVWPYYAFFKKDGNPKPTIDKPITQIRNMRYCLHLFLKVSGNEADPNVLNEQIEKFTQHVNKLDTTQKGFLKEGAVNGIKYIINVNNDMLLFYHEYSIDKNTHFRFSDSTRILHSILQEKYHNDTINLAIYEDALDSIFKSNWNQMNNDKVEIQKVLQHNRTELLHDLTDTYTAIFNEPCNCY